MPQHGKYHKNETDQNKNLLKGKERNKGMSEVEMELEEYINRQIADGYIAEDGYPLKCQHCDSKEINIEYFYDEHVVVEKEATCGNCGSSVGYWSYGTWEV